MDIRLIPDLVSQWIDIVRLKNEMSQDLPRKFRTIWNNLPWTRYQTFYGVLVPVIIHDALFHLHRAPITQNLRKVVSAQALATGFFDDLFDRLHLPPDRIRKLMETPDHIIHSDYLEEYLCQYLFRTMYKHFTGNMNLLEGSVESIMKAQELSYQQLQQSTPLNSKSGSTLDNVLHITREKGAKAVLFYRSCIDQNITKEERNFLSDLGGLFQMTNDINDALKDQQAEETTFMTMGLTLNEIRKIFDMQIWQTFESWKLLSNERFHKEKFFSRINILVARSLVTLDRYSRIVAPENPFNIRAIPDNKVISRLKIPYEVFRWNRHYTAINKTSKMPFVERIN